jgi:lysophospholipase L1-like esterase
MKRIFVPLVLVLISLLVVLSIAEWAVRTFRPQISGEVVYGYDKDLGAVNKPNQRGRKTSPLGNGYNFSHNSLGFRGSREYGPDKGAAFRVLFLGDSFTYGVGVDDAQAFPQRVEEILRAKNYSVEVINAGNPGKGTDYELRFLQIMGPKIKPDLVVVCFYWNDFYDNVEGEYFRLGKNGELIPRKPHSLTARKAKIENLPVIDWLLSWSQAANLIRAAAVNSFRRLGKPTIRSKYNHQVENFDKSWTRVLLKQIIITAKALKSDILFFYLPDEGQIISYRKSGKISFFEKDFDEMVRSQQEEPYSLTPALSAMPGKMSLPYWGHYSPAAHLEAARYISSIIEGWLKRQQNRSKERLSSCRGGKMQG